MPEWHAICSQGQEFRPVQLKMSAQLGGMAVLLCNDRGGTFGAPDVLEAALDSVKVEHALDRRFSDRPPDQVTAPQHLDGYD